MQQQPDRVMNAVAAPQLLFVGDEIKLLEHLIDETPTKFGKQFLNLLAAVRQKRAYEQAQAHEAYLRQQHELQVQFNKDKRKRKKKSEGGDVNESGRV